MRRHGRGFTLVEILVVAGILALMMGILIPAMVKVRESGRRTTCANNVRQIGLALLAYATEHKGELPRIRWKKDVVSPGVYFPPPADSPDPFAATYYNDSSAGLFLLVRQERLPTKIFVCPGTDDVPDDLGGMPASERSNFSKNVPDTDGVRTRSYSYARLYATAAGHDAGFSNKVARMDPSFVLLADYGMSLCALTQDPAKWPDPGKAGNSLNHKQLGQNVLRVDGRVTWETTNRCGAPMPRHPSDPENDNFKGPDNIYKGYGRSFCNPELAANASDSVLEEAVPSLPAP